MRGGIASRRGAPQQAPSAAADTIRRTVRRLQSLALALGLVVSIGVRAQEPTGEYRLKAAFVARFPEFVEWPPPAWEGRATLDVCVTSPNPFGLALADIVRGERVRGRSVSVHEIAGDSDMSKCHVLFVGSDRGRAAVVKRAAALPILTVGDGPRFLDEGGIVQFRIIENRVRFEISAEAAQRAGLRLSPQLLRLASNVRGEP